MSMLSIITPYKNIVGHDIAWVWEYVGSLQSQTCLDFEVIFAGESPLHPAGFGIEMSHVDSTGTVAEAVSEAYCEAKGDYISVLPSNDTLDPDFVVAGLKALDENPDAAFWVPNGARLSADILENSTMCGAFMIRREVWDRIGGFIQSPDGNTGMEDWFMWMRLYKLGYQGITDDRELFHWRRHDDTSMSGKLLGSALQAEKIRWMKEEIKKYEQL